MTSGNVPHRRRLRLGTASLLSILLCTVVIGVGNFASAAEDNEDIALHLATLLRSARAVISDNQKLINDASKGDKGLSGEFVVTKAKANYQAATDVDIDSVDPSTLEGELLQALLGPVAAVMDDAQELINQEGVGFKGFLPAIFARQVTEQFRDKKGDIADLKLTAPKEFVRNRANRPDAWEAEVIENRFKSAELHERRRILPRWRIRMASKPIA